MLHCENKSGEEQESPAVFEFAEFQLAVKSDEKPSPPKLPQLLDVISKLGFTTKFCPIMKSEVNNRIENNKQLFILVNNLQCSDFIFRSYLCAVNR